MTTIKPVGFSVLLSAALIAACTTVERAPAPPPAPVPVAAPKPSADEQLMQCASRIRGMSPAELAAEADTLHKAWNAQRSEENRMRLALFLAVAPAPYGDRLRALSLLDVAPSEQVGRGRGHPLAQVLLPVLQDYRRLDESLAAQQTKLRDLNLSNEQMRQKLDALREIEMQIQERPKTK